MDRIDNMRVFLAITETGSFAAAARRMRITAPSVTRAVASLEQRLGTRLFQRSTRNVRMTDAGHAFAPECRRALDAIDAAESAVGGIDTEPRGKLVVTAPATFGRRFVAPIVLDYVARHPKVDARLVLADRIVDMFAEGIDIALRIGHMRDSSLVATRLGAVRRVVCASPAYLAARGVPRSPKALDEHDAISLPVGNWGPEWAFARAKGGRVATGRPRPRLSVDAVDVAVAAAVAGHGLVRLLSYQVSAEVAAGRLQIVLRDLEPPPIPVQLVQSPHGRTDPKTRAFATFASARLRRELHDIS